MIKSAKNLLGIYKNLFEWSCPPQDSPSRIVHLYDGFNAEATILLLEFALGPSWDIWQELVGDEFSICVTHVGPDYMTIIPPRTTLIREAGGILLEFEDASIPDEHILLSRNGKAYDYITEEGP